MRAHLDELLRPVGITALQYTAMTVLARRSGMSGAELARNSFVTPQSTGDMVNALERRGFVSRTRDPSNARRLLISLTPEGLQLLDEVDGAVTALEATMVAALDPVERAALRDYLNRCRAALTVRREQPAGLG